MTWLCSAQPEEIILEIKAVGLIVNNSASQRISSCRPLQLIGSDFLQHMELSPILGGGIK